jgi:hypothetical protein
MGVQCLAATLKYPLRTIAAFDDAPTLVEDGDHADVGVRAFAFASA